MGKGSRSRRKKKREIKREIKKQNLKNIRKHTLNHHSTDLYGFNTLPVDNSLPENINFEVK